MKLKTLFLTGLFATVLCSCTENGFLLHSNGKNYINQDVNGIYKIGDRYQVNGIWYQPREDYGYKEVGIASWYGPDFHKGSTANGETYNMYKLTAAHKTLPLPSIVKITNLENGKEVVVRVNDRGPFVNNRIIDVSKEAATRLGFVDSGTAKVRVEILAKESKELKQLILDNGGKIVGGSPMSDEITDNIENQEQRQEKQALSISLHPDEMSAVPAEEEPIYQPDEKRVSSVSISERNIDSIAQKGYFIQLGAFKNYENAKALKENFKAYDQVKIIQVNQKQTIYRVRIGPFSEPSQAVEIMDVIREKKGYNDMRLIEEK